MALQTEKIIFELIRQFIADPDTDQNYFGINFRSRYRHSWSLQFGGGRIADENYFGHNFYFIADTDTEKYYFRIISAVNSDKRYTDSYQKVGRPTISFVNQNS